MELAPGGPDVLNEPVDVVVAGEHGVPVEASGELRPVERRILKWRAGGADYADIGRRFHRSAGHSQRIEQLVAYKLDT